jgi:hypothetical protein
MRPADLIPAFSYELRKLRGSLPSDLAVDIRKCERAWERGDSFEFEDEVLSDLFDALNDYAPIYCYFGSHPGDGADYGFWPIDDIEQVFDGLKVSDTSDVPNSYIGEVMHVNDHGNMTLYFARKGKLREAWAIV